MRRTKQLGKRLTRLCLGTGLVCLTALLAAALPQTADTQPTPVASALEKADKLFKEQHWAEARTAYDEARDLATDWRTPDVRKAVEGAVACSLRLQQWDDALTRAQQYVEKTKDAFEEAVGERFLAGLYMTIPHEGTKRGSTYLRGQWTQGVRVSSWRKDRNTAIAHYERARELLTTLRRIAPAVRDPNAMENARRSRAELIGVNFDLATILAQQSPYRYGSWGCLGWWWGWGWDSAAEEESEAVEEADYDEPRWWYHDRYNNEPPTGVPLGPDGQPQFLTVPAEYSPKLGAGPRIRYLLDEIRRLDSSEKKDDAAKALFRWAMIARSLYGPDAARQWESSRVRYDRFNRPLPAEPDEQAPKKRVWELADDEAITLVGGRLRLIALPASESPVALLRLLEEEYPNSTLRPEAHYARALYFQTRQQFPQALAEHRALIERYPEHQRATDARNQIAQIERPEVFFGNSGVYLPGTPPKLAFTFRNADRIDFTATQVDLVRYVREAMEDDSAQWWYYRDLPRTFFEKDHWQKYAGKEVAKWSEAVPRPDGNRVAEDATNAPLTEPGAYVVEGRIAGAESVTRVLVLLTDIALVQKNMGSKGLLWLADARTGLPLPEKAVRVYEHWQEWKNDKHHLHWNSTTLVSNLDGVAEYRRSEHPSGVAVDAIVEGEGGRMAFSFFQNWWQWDPGDYYESGTRYYVITDRPVYRPGHIVHYCIWARELKRGQYVEPRGGGSLHLEIVDARNNVVSSLEVRPDDFGCVTGQYELGDEPPLGIWHIRINNRSPDAHEYAGGLFRVEEYKKPEFEVTVKPARTQARLGDKVKARIAARYYFGAPVAHADVTYKVFREDYRHVYWGPGEYDWLYGNGYGRYYYPYHWFPWWGRWGGFICWDGWWPGYRWGPDPYRFPWGSYGDDTDYRRRYESGTRKALRELVAQGTAQLNPDGSFEVEIDTAPALKDLPDRDHRYTVEVEVRDASRRTITGQGSVIVTRQEFYAFVETDRGWFEPGREAFVEVRTLTPDNVPVAAKGEVVVSRVRYAGADNATVQEDEVKRWPAETDADGRLSFKYPIPAEGQYRIAFKTQDSWKEEVQGNAVFWVCGPKFDGRVYRFNDLEIVADKRTYQIGDTAHLLINTAESNSHILFSDDVTQGLLRSYRFINLPARSTVIDIPVQQRHVPNFFVEATLVRNGRVHTESRELFVPPVKKLLNVALKTDKETYKPGEKGKVQVAVTDATGEPVKGQVALTAYDQAVTYIQDEFGPSPRVFFHGQKRHHTPYVDTSVDHTFSPIGKLERAEYLWYQAQPPEGWGGWWPLGKEGLRLDADARLKLAAARGVDEFAEDVPVASLRERASLSGDGAAWEHAAIAGGRFDFAGYDAMSYGLEMKNGAVFEGTLGQAGAPPGEPPLVEPEVRTYFADTALWLPDLKLSDNGTGEAEITFPQSLTTWRVRGYALTRTTQVGDATATAVTSKNLLVRLQSPRFFVERDEVVLSANVHNYLKTAKDVSAELLIPAGLLSSLGDVAAGVPQAESEPRAPASDPAASATVRLVARASVPAGAEHRFDWPVKVLRPGLARITVKALTDEESDGMQMAFPVLVHGVNKTIAQSGTYRVSQDGERALTLDLPTNIDPEQTKLEITLSPSLAGVMIDALPYLAGYPYGCVEQTMSRFYPSVLVAQTLRKLGTNLEAVGKQRKQMYPPDVEHRFRHLPESPVFDSAELDRMVRAGLERLYSFQHPDGGWGWWRDDQSSPHQTAYVLQGLHAARQADIKIDGGVYDRGLRCLQNAVEQELAKPKEQDREWFMRDLQTQTCIAYTLALDKRINDPELKKWLDALYEKRGDLNNYGRALLALALHQEQRKDEAQTVLRNILQFVERDDSNETAWVRTPGTYWWFWWNNDIETNAWTLRALVNIDPKNDLAPRLVKWLLNNRRNGYYWRSTRDTALTIAAMADYMVVTGEAAPDYKLTVGIDGKPFKEVQVTKDNLFTFDNRVLLYGLQVPPGAHQVTLTKTGSGALYYSAYLSYFTKEEDVKGAGNEIFITREYYKLVPKTESVNLPDSGAARTLPGNQPTPLDQTGRTELRDIYERVPLKTGDEVKSGDQIEVVLKITSKNVYDYLVFEDMKAAGCEPVELRSGGRWAGGLCANVELRDEKVAFFIGLLEQGEHVLRYKLRAETPGKFHALPTTGYAMYAPEVRAISDEMRLGIRD